MLPLGRAGPGRPRLARGTTFARSRVEIRLEPAAQAHLMAGPRERAFVPDAQHERRVGGPRHGQPGAQPKSSFTGLPPSTILIGRPTELMFSLAGSIFSVWQMLVKRSLTATGLSLTSVPSADECADDLAPLDAAAGQGDVEDAGEVVAAGVRVDLRGPAEFAHPDDQGLLEHPLGLQVGDERGEPRVDAAGVLADLLGALLVGIPAVRANLDERHPRLDEAAGEQAAVAEGGLAVGRANSWGSSSERSKAFIRGERTMPAVWR